MLAPALLGIAILAQSPASAWARDYAAADIGVRMLEEGVRERQAAVRQIKTAPRSAAALRALILFDREDEALDTCLRLVRTHALDAADAVRALYWSDISDPARDYSAKLAALAAVVHEQATRLPREDAAALEIALALADVEGAAGLVTTSVIDRLRTIATRFPETRAAATVEMQHLSIGKTRTQWLDRLDAIARAHPGTDIAAAAVYKKARALSADPNGARRELPDPIDRFRRVLATAAELESGAYPKSEGTYYASSLVFQFQPTPNYTPEHLDEAIAGYRAFARTHFRLDPIELGDAGAGYMVTRTMVELFARKGDAGGVDRMLGELETDSPDPQGAGYLRAVLVPQGERLRADRLDAIAADPANVYAPKALATRALDELRGKHAALAREKFREFVQRYPRSGYAWVAALRAVEADATLGDWAAAERGFSAAARAYPSSPLAVVLGRAFAGDAAERQGQPARALDHLTAALAAWDGKMPEVSFYTSLYAPIFRRLDVAQRIATLRASLALPGGPILERARWQLTHDDLDGAMTLLRDFLARYPTSPARPEANLLLHRAQLETALGWVGARCFQCPDGADELDAVSSQPLDSVVFAARIARASLRWTRGDPERGRSAMTSALTSWIKVQPHAEPRSDLEKDVASIREVVFRPLGDGILKEGFAGHAWPAVPFLLVDPDVTVTVHSGDDRVVTITKALPGLPGVVFADKTMVGLLERMKDVFGEEILELWRAFFPARLDSSSDLVLTADPRITRVEFLDAARTRAAAYVSVGGDDARVALQKRGTAWTAVKLLID